MEVCRTSITDVTLLKKLINSKLVAEEAAKLKDKFISLVAHDLRSPFMSIIKLLEMLEINLSDKSEIKDNPKLESAEFSLF